jgi:hypothetical protein
MPRKAIAKMSGQTGPSKKKNMMTKAETPFPVRECTDMVRVAKMRQPRRERRRRMRGAMMRQRKAKRKRARAKAAWPTRT